VKLIRQLKNSDIGAFFGILAEDFTGKMC